MVSNDDEVVIQSPKSEIIQRDGLLTPHGAVSSSHGLSPIDISSHHGLSPHGLSSKGDQQQTQIKLNLKQKRPKTSKPKIVNQNSLSSPKNNFNNFINIDKAQIKIGSKG